MHIAGIVCETLLQGFKLPTSWFKSSVYHIAETSFAVLLMLLFDYFFVFYIRHLQVDEIFKYTRFSFLSLGIYQIVVRIVR